jgi:cell division protein FtsZ
MLSTLDTVIRIPNERLLNAVPKGTRFQESFKMVDDVLLQAVQGISDIITVPGLINVDFADVKAIMEGMGIALMGTGSATGGTRALEATQRDISSPLFEEASIEGAKGLLVDVSGGADLTLFEVTEAMSIIHDSADSDANIVVGAVLDERLTNEMKITVIATGFDKAAAAVELLRAFAASQPAVSEDRVTGPIGIPGSVADPLRREHINVPAFIRKKADWPLASTILRPAGRCESTGPFCQYTPLTVGQQAAVRR